MSDPQEVRVAEWILTKLKSSNYKELLDLKKRILESMELLPFDSLSENQQRTIRHIQEKLAAVERVSTYSPERQQQEATNAAQRLFQSLGRNETDIADFINALPTALGDLLYVLPMETEFIALLCGEE